MHMTKSVRIVTVSLVAAIGLAACSSEPTVKAENESAESVAKKVEAANIRPKAGQWESTMTIEKMEVEGMPPEAKKMMQAALGKGQTFSSCLTPEEAEKPSAEFFQGKDSGCTYEKFEMAGGKLDAVMTCKGGGQSQHMTMTGEYGEEAYQFRATADGEVQPGMPMSMVMTVSSKRTGECTEG
jgi:hypothetical protein